MPGKGKGKEAARLKNWDEATEILALYRESQCALDKKHAALADALRKVQESYQLDIDGLQAEVDEYAEQLHAFAEAHRGNFKSVEEGGQGRTLIRHGVEIGFRLGKPHVETKKKWLDRLIAWLEEIAPGLYVKKDPGLMREALCNELTRCEQLLKTSMDPQERAAAQKFIEGAASRHATLEQDENFVLEVVATP